MQGVTLSPEAGGLRIGCTFLEGSRALGCQLTLCSTEEGAGLVATCRNYTLQRGSPTTLLNMGAGRYVITAVAEMEEEGQLTQLKNISSILGLLEAFVTLRGIPPTPPPATPLTLTTQVQIILNNPTPALVGRSKSAITGIRKLLS